MISRAQLREYIKHALNEMVRAENEYDHAIILAAAKSIEHLAKELREHVEEHGNVDLVTRKFK